MSWYHSENRTRWSEAELMKFINENVNTYNVKHTLHIRDGSGNTRKVSLSTVIDAVLHHCGLRLDYEEPTQGHMTVKKTGVKK